MVTIEWHRRGCCRKSAAAAAVLRMAHRPKYGITEQRTSYKGVMRLTIRSFSSNDVGTYHCVSTNSLGRAEGTLRLYGKTAAFSHSLTLSLTIAFNFFFCCFFSMCIVNSRLPFTSIFICLMRWQKLRRCTKIIRIHFVIINISGTGL